MSLILLLYSLETVTICYIKTFPRVYFFVEFSYITDPYNNNYNGLFFEALVPVLHRWTNFAVYERNSACDSSLEPPWQIKNIGRKIFRFMRASRPQRAKMRSAHYIMYLKMTVLTFGPIK